MLRLFASRMAAVIVFLCVFNVDSHSQDNQCRVNGCGPDGSLGKLIPDKYRGYFVQCEFKSACDEHDKCYSNCLECSSWHGTDRCKDKSCWLRFGNTFKRQCDEQLYKDISLANNNNTVCNGFAAAYEGAVKLLGCGYYYGQTFTLEKQLQFQRNFDALMQYQEFLQKNKIPLDREPLAVFVDQLSQSPAVKENAFAFSVRNGSPTLSLEEAAAKPQSTLEKLQKPLSGGVKIRRYINGVDVTNMIDNSDTFAAENLPKRQQAFDVKIELEFKQGEGPAVLDKSDYKTFRELRELKDLDKFKAVK